MESKQTRDKGKWVAAAKFLTYANASYNITYFFLPR